MNNVQNQKLIDGRFNSTDSLNILFTLFNSKINFHQLEAFRIQIKNTGNIDYHHKRIIELQKSYMSIKEIIENNFSENLEFDINCIIELKPIKKQ
jgi:hypothetical protein